MQSDRGTYSAYDVNVIDTYPLDKLQMIADYHIDITKLLNCNNLFCWTIKAGKSEHFAENAKDMERICWALSYFFRYYKMGDESYADVEIVFTKLFEQITTVEL